MTRDEAERDWEAEHGNHHDDGAIDAELVDEFDGTLPIGDDS